MTINSTTPEFDITVTRVVPADPQAAPIRFLQKLVGATDREAIVRDGMETTLERLEAAVA